MAEMAIASKRASGWAEYGHNMRPCARRMCRIECGIFLIGTFRDASVRQEYGCADMEMAVGSVSPRGGSARDVHKLTVAVREFMVRCAYAV